MRCTDGIEESKRKKNSFFALVEANLCNCIFLYFIGNEEEARSNDRKEAGLFITF